MIWDKARLEEEFPRHGAVGSRPKLVEEGLPADSMVPRRFLDVRYVGQSFELTVDCPALTGRGDLTRSIASEFYAAHLQRFGYADRALPVEVVNLRLKLETGGGQADSGTRPR